MQRTIVLIFICITFSLFGLEKLSEKYCVSFGNPEAPNKVIEYYSFACPHCIALYNSDFKSVRENLIDKDLVYFVFHPIPLDLQTVQAMICLESLDKEEKWIFLDALLCEADIENRENTSILMQKAMECLKKPIPLLLDKDFIEKEPAFQAAYNFLIQSDRIEAIPSAEINGRYFPASVPECSFIEQQIRKNNEKKSDSNCNWGSFFNFLPKL